MLYRFMCRGTVCVVCWCCALLIKAIKIIATPQVGARILFAVQTKLPHGMRTRFARGTVRFRKAPGEVVALNINGACQVVDEKETSESSDVIRKRP
jgi:hypothetical protein